MSLRDDTEHILREWNHHEVSQGAPPVIDFDCHPTREPLDGTLSRLTIRDRLVTLLRQAETPPAERHLADRLHASLAYLDATMGARLPLRKYVQLTQGCDAVGWPVDYVQYVGHAARSALENLGVPWGSDTTRQLTAVEEPVAPEDAADVIRESARIMEKSVRATVASDAPFDLSIEHVDLDEYWAYWLDGGGQNVRMRINVRRASFTVVQARQFALHEILGHGLQCASLAERCARSDVPWVRLTAVHAQQQVLFEGLAQAMPLFVAHDDIKLLARVRLAHYLELVRSELHLAVNAGAPIGDCVDLARSRVPFWTDEGISSALTDRGVNPLLRSYMWAYPAGIDWFINLADHANVETVNSVVTAAYRDPLSPSELMAMWPDGPRIGGPADVAA